MIGKFRLSSWLPLRTLCEQILNQLLGRTRRRKKARRAWLQFEALEQRIVPASNSASEMGTEVYIGVERVGGLDQAATVDFATGGGTATAGQDYVATSGTLAFAEEEWLLTFPITLLDDSLLEGEEWLGLTLSNPSAGSSIDPELGTGSLTLHDDEYNSAPTIDPQWFCLNENSPNGTVVGTVAASDPDPGQSLTLAILAGNDSNAFAINSSTGVLTVSNNAALDYESRFDFYLTIQVQDSYNPAATSTASITIALNDVNENPTDLTLSGNTVAENQPEWTWVGDFSTTDPDSADTHSCTLVSGVGDTDNSAFWIMGAQLYTATELDFETQSTYSIRVRTTDLGGLYFETTFTITSTAANDPPTNLALAGSTVAENSPAGTVIGIFSASDPDAYDYHYYALVSGAGDIDNHYFWLMGDQLYTADELDFETQSSYSIRVRTTDMGGLYVERVFTITVTDTNDAPTNVSLSASTVAENSPAGTVVGLFSAYDPDTGDTLTYNLLDDANGRFRIVSNELQVANGVLLDYEQSSSHFISVRVTDAAGATLDRSFTITVANVNEVPTNIALTGNTVAENALTGTMVGTFSATDPDMGDTLNFSLLDDAGERFGVVGNELHVLNGNLLDYEVATDHTITVRVSDNAGAFTEQVLTIFLTNVNEAPMASADNYTTPDYILFQVEDASAPGALLGLLANDSDPDGDTLTLTAINGNSITFGVPTTLPSGATFTVEADGTFSYLATGFVGVDTLTYTVSDGSLVSMCTVTIEVIGTHAVADLYVVEQGVDFETWSRLVPSVLANDTDPDGYALVALLESGPAHGTLILFLNGDFIYTPDPGFVGIDTFVYRATNEEDLGTVAEVTLTVTNEPVLAVADDYSPPHGQVFDSGASSLLDNDLDPWGGIKQVVAFTQPLYGWVEVFANGQFLYVPMLTAATSDSFTYFVSDGVTFSSATVYLTLTESAPVGGEDYYTIQQGKVLDGVLGTVPALLANDTDSDGDRLYAYPQTYPGHGSLSLWSDGVFVYTPAPGFVGTDSFSYIVSDGILSSEPITVTIEVTNQAPTISPTAYTAHENYPLAAGTNGIPGLLEGASDPDEDVLTVSLQTGPTHGSLVLSTDGKFTYQPFPDYVGPDNFVVAISDGAATLVATIGLTVLADTGTAVAAADGGYAVNRNEVLDTRAAALPSVLANDSDPDGTPVSVISATQPDHGTLTIAPDGHFAYTPAAGYVGTDSFNYTVTDGATATVTITVNNRVPVAGNDGVLIVTADSELELPNPLSNDEDLDGDALTISLVDLPQHGSLTASGNGSWVHTPDAGFFGTDQFSYRASDGLDESNLAWVNLLVVRTVAWDGGGDGTSWTDAFNWDVDAVPDQYSQVVIGAGATVTLDSTAAAVTIHSLDCSGTLNLAGSLTLSANSHCTGTWNQTGQLQLLAGVQLVLEGSPSLSGEADLAAGSALVLASGIAAVVDFTTTGAGLFQVQGATVSWSGTTDLENAAYSAGVWQGDGTVQIGTYLLWTGGFLSGGGLLEIEDEATLAIDDGQQKTLDGWTLRNEGQVDWYGWDSVTSTDGLLDNQADGTITISGDIHLQGSLTISNAGTLIVTEAVVEGVLAASQFTNSGTLSIDGGYFTIGGDSFQSSGRIDLTNGQLTITASGSIGGEVDSDECGILEFQSDSFTLTAGSTVCGGTVSVTAGTLTSAGTFAPALLSIRGATALVNANVTLEELQLDGGTGLAPDGVTLVGDLARLGGSGTVTITEQLTWGNAIMDGSGSTVLATNAKGSLVQLATTGSRTLNRAFTNQGELSWRAGNVLLEATFRNEGTLLIYGGGYFQGAPLARFENAGTVRKLAEQAPHADAADSPTAGATTLGNFVTAGTGSVVDIRAGTLAVLGGSSTGTAWTVADGATFEVAAGRFTVNAGTTITGAGLVRVTGGDLDVASDITVTNLELSSGSIRGTEELTVSRDLRWSGGAMLESGSTTVGANGVLFLYGDGDKTLDRWLNNYGHSVWTESSRTARPGGGVTEYFSNPAVVADRVNQAGSDGWRDYLTRLETARGSANNPATGSLLAGEAALHQQYVEAEERLSARVDAAGVAAEANYQSAMAEAAATWALADPDDPVAEQAYWDAIMAAEDQRDAAIIAASEQYLEAEQRLYDAYRQGLSYLQQTYQQAINLAAEQFRSAQADAGRSGYGDITRFARDMRDWLTGAGRRMVAPILSWYTADTRAALAVAYRRFYGVELKDDIDANLTSFFSSARAIEARAILQAGEAPTAPPAPARQTLLTRLNQWGTDAATWVGQLSWNDVTNSLSGLADAAWDGATQFVTSTAQQLRDDPWGFAISVGQAYRDTNLVVANTLTFGLIPGVNARAEQLVGSSPFYRTIQIGAVIGREVGLGIITGGLGNVVVGLGVRAGGRLALSLMGREALTRAAPRLACWAISAQRLAAPYNAYNNLGWMAANLDDARAAISRGDYEGAAGLVARSAGMIPGTLAALRETARFARAAASMNPQRIRGYLQACFAAGTPIWWEGGYKNIEDFRVGEQVWSRDENDPNGPLQLKAIEELFVRHAPIWHLHVGGQLIRTTDEHPFWVVGKGWTRTVDLRAGEMLLSHDGQVVLIEEVVDTGEWEKVYNFRLAGWHTYFVKGASWQFSVWAHNTCFSLINRDPGLVRHAVDAGHRVQDSLDLLVTKLGQGYLNPGLGTRNIFRNVLEARARDGARVYFRVRSNGTDVDILGKSDKHNQDAVITILRRLYDR